ncbi:MAG: M56 family metallopeptidase [Bacteroidota bacterium]|nr:M56 family metallopeptidase [Bacteroidota bacterium]
MTLITYLLQVTICMACFFAFYMLALQRETTFRNNRIYLIATSLISLILPMIKIYVDTKVQQALIPDAQIFMGNYVDTINEVVITSDQTERWIWMDVFFWIYVAGIIVLSARFLFEIWKILNIKKSGLETEINGNQCILSAKVNSPFSWLGTIYLPLNHSFQEDELGEVILHEQSHIRGKHSYDILFMELMSIVLWLNPVIYLYRRKLRELHEYLADAAVIHHHSWESYAHFLISQKQNGLQNLLSHQLVYSQLKNRLIMITQKPSSRISRIKYLGVLPILMIALILFSFRGKESLVESAPLSLKEMLADQKITPQSPGNTMVEALDRETTKGLADNTERPLFPGCDKVPEMQKAECSQSKLMEFVSKELKYPEVLKKEGIEGKVYVKFTVGINGLVGAARIEKSLHPAADQAALDVVNIMNDKAGKWTPGRKEGRIVSMEMFLPISFVSVDKKEGEAYTVVEEMPRFPGCENQEESARFKCANEEMFKYIYESIKYPKEDREKGNQGMVIAQFVVRPDGSISDAKIVKGVSSGIDAEVVRIIELMNALPYAWIPGKDKGIAVPVQFTMPVKFVLQSANGDIKTSASEDSTKSNVVVTGLSEPTKKDEMPFIYVEKMPSFPGGSEAMYKYIYGSIRYPAEDKQNGISGQTIVQFTVTPEGLLKDIKIVRKVSPAIDAEAVRVVESMNYMSEGWIPGFHNGKPVDVVFTLPIKFVL